MTAPAPYAPPAEPFLTLLAEGAGWAALSKPAGLLTVPGRDPALADCLESRARTRWLWAKAAHRLDMATSGVCLMALEPKSLAALHAEFAARRTEKSYIALVAGDPPAEGRIDLPLRCDWPNRPRQMVAEDGKPAVTDWRVLAREGAATRVALTPLTGRSHQLRVHMAARGWPILGDPLYGDPAAAPRLMLHAERLGFRAPGGGWTEIADPCPF